jgi:hypothetical protein
VYNIEPERALLAIHNKPSRFLVLWDYFALEDFLRTAFLIPAFWVFHSCRPAAPACLLP